MGFLPNLRRRVVALLGAIALLTAALVVAAPGAAVAAGCSVKHVVTVHWGSGFQAQLTITPGAAVTGWTLEYDVAAEQVVTFAAYAGFAQAGSHVTLRNASFNGNVPAGASVNILVGVHNNPTFTNVPPASFVLNGQACSYTPQPYLAAERLPGHRAGGRLDRRHGAADQPPARERHRHRDRRFPGVGDHSIAHGVHLHPGELERAADADAGVH